MTNPAKIVTFTSTELKADEVVLTVYFQITEYSEFKGIDKDNEVQLLYEQPTWGLNPQDQCYLAPCSNQLSYSQGCQRDICQNVTNSWVPICFADSILTKMLISYGTAFTMGVWP